MLNESQHPDTQSALFQEILHDARVLVEQAAHGKNRMLHVSPEVAQLLKGLQTGGAAPVADTGTHFSAIAEDKAAALATLAEEVASCRKCGLCETRTQTVFGVGNPNADLLFVGEAPGFYEDQQGVPFVGKAGELLTDIIQKGMNLSRNDVYICNLIKCRPPENRDPNPVEVQACEAHLLKQLEIIQPKVICTLGKYATQTLLHSDAPISSLRGKWHEYKGIPLMPTFHPAYLLRNEADKKKTWKDIQEIMRFLGMRK